MNLSEIVSAEKALAGAKEALRAHAERQQALACCVSRVMSGVQNLLGDDPILHREVRVEPEFFDQMAELLETYGCKLVHSSDLVNHYRFEVL